MFLSVFNDLKFFLIFFGIFIFFFSLFVTIIADQPTLEEAYSGLGYFSYLVVVLRTSVGDNQMEDYSGSSTISWVVWFMILLAGNIIFMNFIIAVVSESYEKCMSMIVIQFYKVKIDMILEREQMLTKIDFENKEWFPRYIIVTQVVGNSNGASNEWNGFL